MRAGLLRPRGKAVHFAQPVFSLGHAKVDLNKAGALAAGLEDRDTVVAGKRTHI